MANQTIPYLDPVVVSKLKNIEIKARLIVEGFITGLHKSPYHGFSVEFAEHRSYNNGESLRNIDWKVYAKTDKLFVKRYEEETNLRCNIVLDISDSMRYPENGISKLEYGAYLSAALAYLMMLQKDASGLTLFHEQITTYIPPKAKRSWLLQMFTTVEQVVQEKEVFLHKTATATVLHQLAQKFHRRSLVIIITDLFQNVSQLDDLFPALQHLRHENHEVLVFQLLDKSTEEEFAFTDQSILLKDLETGEELRVQPSQIREAYQTKMRELKDTFRRRCRELSIEFIEVDIRTPYDKALTDYLIKRKMLTK
ncbi:MAG: DUF58 domain-containing protein [Bacteroidia bacterium]|nr:DUF58 domain-containing protein [Bacteroidia bacterium]